MRSYDHVSTWSYVSRQKPVAWAEVLRLWLLPWLLPPCPASSWGPSLTPPQPRPPPSCPSSPRRPRRRTSPHYSSRASSFLQSAIASEGEVAPFPIPLRWGILYMRQSVAWLVIDHGDLWEEKWKQCSSKLACCAQLLHHILPHFPECIAQSIFTYLNLAQLVVSIFLSKVPSAFPE